MKTGLLSLGLLTVMLHTICDAGTQSLKWYKVDDRILSSTQKFKSEENPPVHLLLKTDGTRLILLCIRT